MMSQQPPPTDPGPGPARPAQGWAPAPLAGNERPSLAGHTGTDTGSPDAVHGRAAIDRYAPRRSVFPVLAIIVAVVAAAVIFYTSSRPAPAPVASATPSRSATSKATPLPGTQFTSPRTNATGRWQITKSRWTPNGLDVFVEITLASGRLMPTFAAMPNSGSGYVPAEASTLTPNFTDGAIQPGTTTDGWLFFATTRETTLIFLGDAANPQISAIEVTG